MRQISLLFIFRIESVKKNSLPSQSAFFDFSNNISWFIRSILNPSVGRKPIVLMNQRSQNNLLDAIISSKCQKKINGDKIDKNIFSNTALAGQHRNEHGQKKLKISYQVVKRPTDRKIFKKKIKFIFNPTNKPVSTFD